MGLPAAHCPTSMEVRHAPVADVELVPERRRSSNVSGGPKVMPSKRAPGFDPGLMASDANAFMDRKSVRQRSLPPVDGTIRGPDPSGQIVRKFACHLVHMIVVE
jgi:hypothetical protein